MKPESKYEGNDKIWTWRLFGSPADGYDVVLVTFRLTEQYHTLTRVVPLLNELQPKLFVEIPEDLAASLGIKTGDYVVIESARAIIVCKALVTSRMDGVVVNGRPVHMVAISFHWGYSGLSVGSISNFITIQALDPIAKIHEAKTCLVKVRRPTPE